MTNHRQTCAFCGKRFVGPDNADWLKIGFTPVLGGKFSGTVGPACKRCKEKAESLLRKN